MELEKIDLRSHLIKMGMPILQEIIGKEELKDIIRELIDSEDKTNPLSDLEISNLLKEQNISIARRTVAKYRESMNIPNVKRRKQSEH